MSASRKLNLLLINSIYFVFAFLEIQRILIQSKSYRKTFYSVWKETSHKPLAVSNGYSFILGLLRHFISICNRSYYKMGQLFCYKMRQKFVQNATILCDSYYKLRCLLQNALVHRAGSKI